ncbi:SDR family NAD(P)-dependent oxidoreductase, partial [Mesorhizobium sp. M2D.F.Ca.ET.145.01.1.1]
MIDAYATFAPDSFAGKTVLVTGAASGMGFETARAFLSKGAEVVMCDRDAEGLARRHDELGGMAGTPHKVVADMGDPDSIGRMFDYCDARLARLDNVVTCAAIITAKRIPDQDWAHWQRVLGVNLLGTFFTVQGAVQRMQGSGG